MSTALPKVIIEMNDLMQSAVQLKQTQVDAARPRFLKTPDYQQHTLFHFDIAANEASEEETPIQVSMRAACIGSLRHRAVWKRILIVEGVKLAEDGDRVSDREQRVARTLLEDVAGVYQFVLEQLQMAGSLFNAKAESDIEKGTNLAAAVGHYEAAYGVFSFLEPKGIDDVTTTVTAKQLDKVAAVKKAGIADSDVTYHTFTPQQALVPVLTFTSAIVRKIRDTSNDTHSSLHDDTIVCVEGIHRAIRELVFVSLPKLMCNLALALNRQGQDEVASAALKETLTDLCVGRGSFVHNVLTGGATPSDKWVSLLGGPSQRAAFLLATVAERSPKATSTSLEQVVRTLSNVCNSHKLLPRSQELLEGAPDVVRALAAERTECLRTLQRLQTEVKTQREKDSKRFGGGKLAKAISGDGRDQKFAQPIPPHSSKSRTDEIVSILDGIRRNGEDPSEDSNNSDLVGPLRRELLRCLCWRLVGEVMSPLRKFNVCDPSPPIASAANALGLSLGAVSPQHIPNAVGHSEAFDTQEVNGTIRSLIRDRLLGLWTNVSKINPRRLLDGSDAERLVPFTSLRPFIAAHSPPLANGPQHWLLGACREDLRLKEWLQSTELERGEETLKDIDELFFEKERMMKVRGS